MEGMTLNNKRDLKSVEELKMKINNDNYSLSTNLYAGSKILILPKYHGLVNEKKGGPENITKIVTPYPFQVSWLLFQLSDIIYKNYIIDSITGYYVFGSIGYSIIHYHQKNGDGEEVGLLNYVLEESRDIIYNINGAECAAFA